MLAGMNFLWVSVGCCAPFYGRYGSVWTFYGSVWVSVGGCEIFIDGCRWVGVSGCETFTGGCGLVWVGMVGAKNDKPDSHIICSDNGLIYVYYNKSSHLPTFRTFSLKKYLRKTFSKRKLEPVETCFERWR